MKRDIEYWNRRAKSILKTAVSKNTVQPNAKEKLVDKVCRIALEIDRSADLKKFPEALEFQMDMARKLLKEYNVVPTL